MEYDGEWAQNPEGESELVEAFFTLIASGVFCCAQFSMLRSIEKIRFTCVIVNICSQTQKKKTPSEQ